VPLARTALEILGKRLRVKLPERGIELDEECRKGRGLSTADRFDSRNEGVTARVDEEVAADVAARRTDAHRAHAARARVELIQDMIEVPEGVYVRASAGDGNQRFARRGQMLPAGGAAAPAPPMAAPPPHPPSAP